MEYSIAIPSYQRECVIGEHTLKYLRDVGISSDRINIFVANELEAKAYKNEVPKELYNEIIVGKLGIGNQRTFIRKYYPKEEKLIMLDDDIQELVKLDRVERTETLLNFKKAIRLSYKLMKKHKAGLMGVSSMNFPMYMSHSYNVGLYFLIGLCTFEINTQDLTTFLEASEDYEISIKSFIKYGKVLRWNNISAINNSRKKRLGMISAVNTNVNFKTKEKLLKRYPMYIKENPKKYNTFEISMIKQPINERIYLKNNIFD